MTGGFRRTRRRDKGQAAPTSRLCVRFCSSKAEKTGRQLLGIERQAGAYVQKGFLE